MIIYRISKKQYIDDLSGFGAANYPGRWNSKGVYILYAAATASLALLESVVHISSLVQVDYCIATIYLPDDDYPAIQASNLPKGWQQFPPPDYLKTYGDAFVQKRESLALKVPSAIMPEDFNFLVNPAHPLFAKVKITGTRVLEIDSRLL